MESKTAPAPRVFIKTTPFEETKPLFDALLLLLLQLSLYKIFRYFPGPDVETYFSSSILRGILTDSSLIIIYSSLFGILLLNFSKLTWLKLNVSQYFRIMMTLVVGAFAWEYSCYDYNFYFNQPHYFDRLALVLLCVGFYVHPIFILPYLVSLISIVHQFSFEIGPFSFTDKYLPFNCLIIFCAFLLQRSIYKVHIRIFLYVTLIMVGGAYFEAAMAKIKLEEMPWDWLLYNELDSLLISSYVNGWLKSVPEEYILNIASYISYLNFPMQVGALIVELAGVVILILPSISLIVLAGFILLHALIYISSGIFFWHWIVLDIALMVIILRSHKENVDFFSRKLLVLVSPVIIVVSSLFFDPIPLGWYDSRINNYFEFEVEVENGEKMRLSREFFSPYDIIFSQDEFFYITEELVTAGTYGTIFGFDLLKDLQTASLKDVENIEITYGTKRYNEYRKNKFLEYIKNYVLNYNKRHGRELLINRFRAPYHIHASDPNLVDTPPLPIKSIDVIFKRTFYDREKIHYLKEKNILNIKIPVN